MVKLSQVTLDKERQTEGVWSPDPWGHGFEFLIASSDSPDFRRAASEAVRLRDDPKTTDKDVQDALTRAVAKHILKGWRGLEDDSDAPIPYSFERSCDYMGLPQFAHFRSWVESASGRTERFFCTSAEQAGKG